MKKTAIVIFLLTLYINGNCQYQSISFYVIAHPDQWELFMGENAYQDISSVVNGPQNKVVFIYATTGSDGCNSGHLNISNYLTRQAGANNSVEFCADKVGSHSEWFTDHVSVQGHNILKYIYKNTVSYCLRLPDGCNGQNIFGQSLQLLHDGAISSIIAVDSSATYTGWSDLTNTVNQIIISEKGPIDHIYINTADTDVSINKGDNPDHIYTGMLCMDAVNAISPLTINLFVEFGVAALPSNLDEFSIATNAALLSQLDYTGTENGLPSEWTTLNINYMSRNYFRTVIK